MWGVRVSVLGLPIWGEFFILGVPIQGVCLYTGGTTCSKGGVCRHTGGTYTGSGSVFIPGGSYVGWGRSTSIPACYRRRGGGGVCELSLTLGNAYTGRGVCLPQGSPRARPPAPGAPAHGGSPGARAGRRPHLVAEDLVEGGPGPAQGAEEGEPEPERAVVARLQQHHLRHDQRRVPHVAAELRRHRPPATARRKWRPPPPGSSAP